MNKPNSISQFLQEYGTEEACESYLSFIRWPENVYCPFCGFEKIYVTARKRGFACAGCKKKFSLTVGTLFENSKIPLKTWFLIIYLQCLNKKNISSVQTGRNLGITQKTAWLVTHKIRQLYWQENVRLSGIVEIDECFLAASKRFWRWGSVSGRKAPILGLIERGGKVVIECIPDRSTSSINQIVSHYVEEGSIIYTDGWIGYQDLKQRYTHEYLDHSAREYVRGEKVHTNTIENVWRQLKQNIRGAHHSVSKEHVQFYCDEVAYRLNNRDKKPGEKFNELLGRAVSRKALKVESEILKVA